jgi:ketosteroid isomerase-like protein
MKNRNVIRAIRVALFVTAVLTLCRGFFAAEVAGRKSAEAPKPGVLRGASTDELKIRELLAEQAGAWNRGDIDSFMSTYWKSDETLFVGAAGVARGWQAVLDRYHRAYPDRRAMGHLTFSNLEVHAYCSDSALALGNYHLDRENDHPEGVFTLDLRKLPEGWRIAVDHTTAFSPTKALQSQ